MTISQYLDLQTRVLQSHPHPPYNRENEGMVYVGFPTKKFPFSSPQEKSCCAHYLCLFVTLDLVVYANFRERYIQLKQELHIPKFEYGLTNIFICPSALHDHFKIGLNQERFNACFHQFEHYIEKKLQSNNINLDWRTIKNMILEDHDLSQGIFGHMLIQSITQSTR